MTDDSFTKIYGGFIEFDKDEPNKINIIDINEVNLNEDGLYECKICYKKFVKKDYYKRHVKSHYDKFECTVCKKKIHAWSSS